MRLTEKDAPRAWAAYLQRRAENDEALVAAVQLAEQRAAHAKAELARLAAYAQRHEAAA